MRNEEINGLISWCRKKLDSVKRLYASEKYKKGYEDAMLAVMSYLHSEKNKENNYDRDENG